jgi:hypothetical protein
MRLRELRRAAQAWHLGTVQLSKSSPRRLPRRMRSCGQQPQPPDTGCTEIAIRQTKLRRLRYNHPNQRLSVRRRFDIHRGSLATGEEPCFPESLH